MTVRLSTPADIPALRELWELAFGDSGPYVDNFFNTYYRPERMFVLEEEGCVRAMTAWFDTSFFLPGQGEYRAAYLYAVATHPACRGRGLAGRLLAWADDRFRSLNIPVVTTVPAEPSLHNFFGANGFSECFVTRRSTLTADTLPAAGTAYLAPVSPAEYGALRRDLLAHLPHIAYPDDALAYQQGCCAIGGLSLLAGHTPAGPVAVCPERADGELVVLKEVLGSPEALQLVLSDLPRVAPARVWQLREPLFPGSDFCDAWPFGMVKWLDKTLISQGNPNVFAYLGLAFD